MFSIRRSGYRFSQPVHLSLLEKGRERKGLNHSLRLKGDKSSVNWIWFKFACRFKTDWTFSGRLAHLMANLIAIIAMLLSPPYYLLKLTYNSSIQNKGNQDHDYTLHVILTTLFSVFGKVMKQSLLGLILLSSLPWKEESDIWFKTSKLIIQVYDTAKIGVHVGSLAKLYQPNSTNISWYFYSTRLI